MLELIVAVVSAILGGIASYIVSRLLLPKKLIEYEFNSIPLLRLNLQNDSTISVSVKKSLITGDKADDLQTIGLKNIYGFQVKLVNAGNEDIEKIDDIKVCLSKEAKIIKCDTEPASTKGYMINVEKDSQENNIYHVSIPYLNKRDQIILKLISTENDDSICHVKAYGFRIKTRMARPPIIWSRIMAITMIIVGFIDFSLLMLDQALHNYLNLMLSDPYYLVAFGLSTMSIAMFTALSLIQRKATIRRKIHSDWNWEIPKIAKSNKKGSP